MEYVMKIFSKLKAMLSSLFTGSKKVAVFCLLSMTALFAQPTLAADWDTTALVKTITDGSAIVISIGTAILGVIVLIFGFKMAKRMIGA